MNNYIVKQWYNYISSHDLNEKVIFLNYGYIGKDNIILNKSEKKYKTSIQLYYHAVKNLHLKNKIILEVGSGRGGGANFITNRWRPKKYYGLDLSENATSFCKSFYKNPQLEFINGNALDLPFSSNYFDAVLNIESSHTYPSFEKFLKEVYRVLKPNGTFVLVDHRPKNETKDLLFTIKKNGFLIKTKENITQNIIKALNYDSVKKEQLIKNISPFFLTSLFLDFAGVKGSPIYNRFKNEETLYWKFALKK